ncbi:MAG TPA: multicopper oxidase domain-containing protein [Mycobacteriales bacterium]|nr:multicopper oxidase domain-containing protein [Mycobacteriales bacterium]
MHLHGSGGLSRRGLLRGLGGSVLGSLGLRLGGAAALLGVWSRSAAGASPFVTPLRMPPVLTGSHVTLVAKEALVQLVPGVPTRMWTFNGTFPGPVIRRPSGTPTRVTVRHRLPSRVGSLTIHHHGSHSASSEDGQPERNVIAPGRERTYTYGLREDGRPERAATQWYHDHSHYRTTRNVWHGLAGFFIVDDAVDAALPLPKGRYDVPLMLTERALDASNQLVDAFVDYATATATGQLTPGSGYAPLDDLGGNRLLVNGVERAHLDVAARRYRLRLLNTSPFHPYNLRLSDGSTMLQIATESGLMPKPLARKELLLGPAERAEVVVDFRGREGRALVLESVDRSDGGPLPATAPALGQFLEFRVNQRARETSRVPARLRPLPSWVASASTQPHRVWAFGVGLDQQARGAWTINGRAFDHMRVDAHPELGAVETWLLVNLSPNLVSHYIHIHDIDWKVLQRNGSAPEPGEDCLKETFRLDPGEVLLIAGRFSDHLGHYMLHCHMLQHEDHGMMTSFEVVKPGQGDAGPVGLESALSRSISDPVHRAQVRRVVEAARGGRPAPASALPSLRASNATSLAQILGSGGPGIVCEP